ncbi:hypothetical protein RSAG8_03722, partial [Rhizoctonia solani AG-8 WAC10335]
MDEQKTEARLSRIAPSMTACFNSSERRKCTENTREKVLSDLMAWKSDQDGETVCWMNGMAGTGKTTIVNTLCDILDNNHELGASFFCTRSLPECRNVKLILPTIAYQLARFSIPFQNALSQALVEDPDVHTKVLRLQFERMILKPLQAVTPSLPGTVVVVIDALDECEDDDAVEQILDLLFKHASRLPIRFLVSSRPEHHIREKTYLREELANISLTDDQLKTLVERAGVLFIYAATLARYIKARNSQKRLDTILKSTGSGLQSSNNAIDSLYEVVLTSALNNRDLEPLEKEQMRLILHTVVCAQEPLTVNALAGLLMLTCPEVHDALRPLWSVLHISNLHVNTLHASFPEYILDSNRSNQFACNPEAHNGKLAELCFKRINQNNTQFNLCNLSSSCVFDDDIPNLDLKTKEAVPFDLLYACQYWAVHLALGGKSKSQAKALHEFLSKRLLLWMEVLNLSKRIEKGVGLMEKAVAWLRATDSQSMATKLLARDARRFVSMFATSPVSRSTPHLYISMLSSWPKFQPMAKCYTQRANGLPNIMEIKATERQPLLSAIPVGCAVYCVNFAPNGAFFVAGTSNYTILVWDALSCQMTIDPIKGGHITTSICISPDSTRICSGSLDSSIYIWDPQNGQLVAGPLEGHTRPVDSVDYSPDGSYIASGSRDGTIRVWSTQTWQMEGDPLEGNDGVVFTVAFSPDGSRVASGSFSLIHIWDHRSGKLIGDPLKGHSEYVRSLKFLPDGTHLVSISENSIMHIWDLNSGQIIRQISSFQEHLLRGGVVAISPANAFCACAPGDFTVRLWDTQTWQTHSIMWHTSFVESIAFSPDGSRLISVSKDKRLSVWEVQELDQKVSLNQSEFEGHSGVVQSVSFSPCGAYIVSGSDDSTIRMWDAQTGQPIRSPIKEHNGRVKSVGFLHNGARITSVSDTGTICMWDAQNGDLANTFCPIETVEEPNPFFPEYWPVAFSPDGSRIAVGTSVGNIHICEDQKKSLLLTRHRASVTSIAFSPDQRFIFSGSQCGELMMWDSHTGDPLPISFAGHETVVYSVDVAPNGSRIASGSRDTFIRVWDAQNGELVGDSLQGHNDAIYSVSFSPCGTYIVSGSQDRTVRLWDVASGQSVVVFQGHTDRVRSVAFSPDGTQIVSGSADLAIRVWDVPTSKDDLSSGGSEDSEELPGGHVHDEEGSPDIDWTMDEDGWVCDNKARLLLWVPPDLRSILLWRHNKMLISRHGCVKLNFANARIDEGWITCYQP